MHIKINNVEVDLDEGSTIEDAIKITNAPYQKGCAIALIDGHQELENQVDKYEIHTTKGTIIIELLNVPELVDFWKKNYKHFISKNIRWTTSSEASIGPIKTDLKPTNEEYLYNRWDVLISLSSFSNESTHIIFSKNKHKSIYGVPGYNKGIFANVVGGKRTVINLTNNDSIIDINPVIERKSIVNSSSVTDFKIKLKENNELYTFLEVEANPDAPISFEHFLKLIDDGTLKVDYESESFIGAYALKGLEKDKEIVTKRKRGYVTLRNKGKSVGCVYLYREERVSAMAHNTIGFISKGIELLDTIHKNDKITVRTNPLKISTVASTQKEADEYLTNHNIQHQRDGLSDDDAVVVAQDPVYTLDIAKSQFVKTLGVSKEDFVEIELYDDESPNSVWYFKKITGLLDGDVGHLRVNLAINEMDIVMFKQVNKEAKGLIPEKLPNGIVKAWEICVSNTACKHVGTIGIRFKDNTEFGSTGESFGSTNIIGKLVNGQENLKKLKEGDTVYVTIK